MTTKKTELVRAIDTFTIALKVVRKGDILPADDPLVIAKPRFFAPYVRT